VERAGRYDPSAIVEDLRAVAASRNGTYSGTTDPATAMGLESLSRDLSADIRSAHRYEQAQRAAGHGHSAYAHELHDWGHGEGGFGGGHH